MLKNLFHVFKRLVSLLYNKSPRYFRTRGPFLVRQALLEVTDVTGQLVYTRVVYQHIIHYIIIPLVPILP
jgi:hypothetical protein